MSDEYQIEKMDRVVLVNLGGGNWQAHVEHPENRDGMVQLAGAHGQPLDELLAAILPRLKAAQ